MAFAPFPQLFALCRCPPPRRSSVLNSFRSRMLCLYIRFFCCLARVCYLSFLSLLHCAVVCWNVFEKLIFLLTHFMNAQMTREVYLLCMCTACVLIRWHWFEYAVAAHHRTHILCRRYSTTAKKREKKTRKKFVTKRPPRQSQSNLYKNFYLSLAARCCLLILSLKTSLKTICTSTKRQFHFSFRVHARIATARTHRSVYIKSYWFRFFYFAFARCDLIKKADNKRKKVSAGTATTKWYCMRRRREREGGLRKSDSAEVKEEEEEGKNFRMKNVIANVNYIVRNTGIKMQSWRYKRRVQKERKKEY